MRAVRTPARVSRYGPIASASTGLEPKHSSASRGSSTIGRPAVFSDVLTTTGTPVRASKHSSIRATSGSSSRSTVWMRAVPSTCTTAGMRSRHSSCTPWVKSMYGEGIGPSRKISDARSASTIGATGRNCSRPLMSLSFSRFSGRRGSASSERCPSARGPNSERPWNQATTPSSASTAATASAMSSGSVNSTPAVDSAAASPASSQPRPSAAVRIGATASPSACATCSAAPERRPGVARGRLHPDARERSFSPQPRVRDAVQAPRRPPARGPGRRCAGAASAPAPAAPPPAAAAPSTPARRARR